MLPAVHSGPRALLTVDESPASLAATRALHAAGYRVHLVVTRRDTYAARSSAATTVDHAPDWARDRDGYVAAVADVARRRAVEVVLPGTEGTLRALTGHEARLPEGVTVGTCAPDALEAATSKSAFQRLAAESGLAVIPAVEVGAVDLSDRAGEIRFPAMAKPLYSVQPTGDGRMVKGRVTHVAGLGELRTLVSAAPAGRWIVQQRVDGTLGAIGGVAWRGELVCATHQISLRIWPVDSGVTSWAMTVAPDRDGERGVADLLRRIGWSGVFGVQFLRRGSDAYAIDLNPRIYGSIGLAIAAGQNLPAIWADLLLGHVPRVGASRRGVRYRVGEDDLRALAWAFRQGRRREALAGLVPRPRTARAVLSLRDPRPAAVSLAKAGRMLGRMVSR